MTKQFFQLWAVSTVALFLLPASLFGQTGTPPRQPTKVEISVMLLDLEKIEDASQSFTINLFYAARWHDPRLVHDGPGNLQRDLNEVWNPRIEIVNRRQVSETMPKTVEISPDGTVTYRQRLYGQFSQKLDLLDFPFDHHNFTVQMVAVGYKEDDIVFVDSAQFPSRVLPDLSISDWTILGASGKPFAYEPLPGVKGNAGFLFQFHATRMIGYFFWKIILPLMLVVAMSWLVFWIDPELSGPQISVAVTSMLTLIAYRFMIGGTLPRISYLTRMDIFILMSTILVFLTLLEASVTVGLVKKGKQAQAYALDRICRWAFPLAYAISFLGAALL